MKELLMDFFFTAHNANGGPDDEMKRLAHLSLGIKDGEIAIQCPTHPIFKDHESRILFPTDKSMKPLISTTIIPEADLKVQAPTAGREGASAEAELGVDIRLKFFDALGIVT
jgi:hypothetical protein